MTCSISRQFYRDTIIVVIHGCESRRKVSIKTLLSFLRFSYNIDLITMLFELLYAQILVLLAELLVKLNLGVVRQIVANLDASLLPSQSH